MTFAVITAVCLIAVVFWELRQKEPVIDFHILKDRNYMLATRLHAGAGIRALRQHRAAAPVPADPARLHRHAQRHGAFARRHRGHLLHAAGRDSAAPLRGPLAGDLRRPRCRPPACYLMSKFNLQVDYRTAVWSRIMQSAGMAFLFVPISVAAFRLHPQGAHQLRHRPVQPGAQHRRQLRHRHRDHPAGAPLPVPSADPHRAPHALRPAVPGRPGPLHRSSCRRTAPRSPMPPARRRA